MRLSDGTLLANAFQWVFAPIEERDRLAGRPRQSTVDSLGVAMACGGVLLTRGYRREPFGVRAYLSEGEGATWPTEIVLRDDGLDRDVGYPTTVQFDDGRLLTVYYWHGEDQVRHLQRATWELR